MLKLRSVKGRSFLAGLALLVLLLGVAALAVWRTQSERSSRKELEQRAFALSALESARAQIFMIGTYTALSAFADDPAFFVQQYQQGRSTATQAMQEVRDQLVAVGETEDVAAIDEMATEVERLLADADAILASFPDMSREQRLEYARQAENEMWPTAAPLIVDMLQLAQELQTKLSAERAAADSASDKSLTLLIALSTLLFLVASGILLTFISSLVRPLASLKASARAIISGDLQARANESGPEEVVSVARDVNEMTQALLDRTERLVLSEQRFRDVLEVSRDLVYKLNMETRTYDYVSPSAVELVGFTPEEIVAMGLDGVRARFHPEDTARFASPSKDPSTESANDRASPSIEYRWKCADGEYRWFNDNRNFVRDDAGKMLAVVGAMRDITSRKASEDALRESEERFRSLSASSPVGIFSIDTEGRFAYGNQHLLDDFGVKSEDLLGQLWAWNIHPDDRRATIDEGVDAARENRTFSREYRILRPDGEMRWIRTVSNPIVSRDGVLVSYVGVAEDITERKRAENALRESEERFRTLSASAPVGIFLMDEKGKIIYVNERLRAISGSPVQSGTTDELALAVHPDDRGQLLGEWAKARGEHKEFLREYRILTPQGETRWVRMRVSQLSSAVSADGGVVGTVEDVTARKTAEQQAAHRIEVESAVAHASNLLAGSDELDEALDLAVRILGEAFCAERAHTFVLDGKTRMHCIAEWCAPGTDEATNLHDFDAIAFPWSVRKMLQAEPVIVNDVGSLPPEAAAEKSLWESLDVRSIAAVPLASDGRIIGSLILDTTKDTCVWLEEDIRLLRLAADTISSFIERRRAGEEKHQAYESIIFLLASAAEARDPYTEHHLQRVRGYTEAIALELGLSPEEAQEAGLIALLHDLGKIRVPDSILTKPGPLSEEEWQVMRKHTVWGEDLLPDDPWFKTAREIARWHHENWDGTGYPDGLHGDMIPLCTAIIAVADGFDAMTSRRPYKGPWPPVRAMREITRQSGKMYSPIVVDAFLRAVDKGEIDRIVVSPRAKPPDISRAA